MGLFDGLKRTFNIGGCSIIIETEREFQPQGSMISGNVIIQGGKLEQSGRSIEVELEEFWTERRGTGKNSRTVTVYRTRNSQILEDQFTISPGDDVSYLFDLQLPRNSRLSTSSTGWRLKVTMDIPKAIDPYKTVKLKVVPAFEFQAIVQACEERLQFYEKKNSYRWSTSYSTYFRLLPSEEMKKEFDYIAFDLSQTGNNGVNGEIIFNLQEKSFKDYLKAMVMMDRIKKSFTLNEGQLFMDDNTVNCDAIATMIDPMIQEIIKDRNEYERGTPKESPKKKKAAPKKSKRKKFDPKKLDF